MHCGICDREIGYDQETVNAHLDGRCNEAESIPSEEEIRQVLERFIKAIRDGGWPTSSMRPGDTLTIDFGGLMALIVTFVNKSQTDIVADYEVNVYVNNRLIAGPFPVRGHKRAEGWAKLVEQFVRERREHENAKPASIRSYR